MRPRDPPKTGRVSKTARVENLSAYPGLTAQHEPRKLSPAAQRALAEAAERRAGIDRRVAEMPAEQSGRKGPEPVRYGDWEVSGLASDF